MVNGPNRLEIDLSALVHNLHQIRSRLRRGTAIMGVVKSDAYGHGLLPTSRALVENGISCLGVAHLHEALELRRQGLKLPIVVLCGVRTREECLEVIEMDLTPVLFDMETADILARESAKRKRHTRIHLKVDTGMGRLGVPPADVAPFVRGVLQLEYLHLEAITSHLSCAEESDGEFTDIQVERFKEAVESVMKMGLRLPLNNLANSAGSLCHGGTHFGMVRSGICLYGGHPSTDFASPIELKPVMHLKGEVLQVREFSAGTPVSYGRTYYTSGRQKIAVLSAGYGDGLPRAMSNRGYVLVHNRRVPIVGRICMNMTMCDVTALSGVKKGDEVVFLGTQGGESISADDLAGWTGTISYEVFCSLGRQNLRTYLP